MRRNATFLRPWSCRSGSRITIHRGTNDCKLSARGPRNNANGKSSSGTVRLPAVPRPGMSICVLGDQHDIDRSKHQGIDAMSADDLKKLNKNKKLIKKLARKYDAFLASDALIKQIPRLLGPGLSKGGSMMKQHRGGANEIQSWQIPCTHLSRRRPQCQSHRSQVDNQIPAEKSALSGRRSRQCGDDGRSTHWEHHAGNQLPRVTIKEGMAECREPDDQGNHVSTPTTVLERAKNQAM